MNSVFFTFIRLSISISIVFILGVKPIAAVQTEISTTTVPDPSHSSSSTSLEPRLGRIAAFGPNKASAAIDSSQSMLIVALNSASSTTPQTSNIPQPPRDNVAVLSISAPSLLNISAKQGSSTIQTHTLTFHNGGPAKTESAWSITSTEPWLTFSTTSGTLIGGKSHSVTMAINPKGLNIGVYDATVVISDNNDPSSSHELHVVLTVHSIIDGYPVTSMERTFPRDTGMIDVRDKYGAKGDGVTDDTRAIQTAISANIHNPNGAILYFSSGIYLVSKPLLYKNASNAWSSALTLQGQNQETTIIKLIDNNQLYQNSNAPEDVLNTASQNTFGNGAGNSAFDNYIFDMTIDVGRGNNGAVALDFMGNNYCGLRNVTLKSSDPDHAGAIGLSMLRYATGPCLMKNVVIDGFNYGIKAAQTEYSATFEGLTLLNQHLYGIYNSGNVLSIRGLASTNRVPAIYNDSSLGMITLLTGALLGGSASVSAIDNNGTLYARSITSAGYGSVLKSGQRIVSGSSLIEYDSGKVRGLFQYSASSLNLPIQETPQFEDSNLSHWANVISFGADPKGYSDSTSAIQAAIDSGATTVYFPTGKYIATRTIFVRGSVRMIDGFDSYITPPRGSFQSLNNPTPLFEIDAGPSEVTLRHFQLGNWGAYSYPGILFIEQNSARPVVLLDSAYLSLGAVGAIGYQNSASGTGSLFIENVSAGPWNILTPQNVFARQVNPESSGTKILNRGGHLWILGLKTEQEGTNIETDNGGCTELLGGLLYPAHTVPSDQSAFMIDDSRASLIYAASNYSRPSSDPYADFHTQVTETQNGVTRFLPTTSLPSRGYGIMMPLYSNAVPAVSHKGKQSGDR